MQQSNLNINVIASAKTELYQQLIRLGDMIGDGLHLEPDGKWIAKEYVKVARALGYRPKRADHSAQINAVMLKRVADVPCGQCGLALKQTKSGSKRAVCANGHKWQLLK
ncbi:hypothetical protein L5L78_20740 [Shewanella sp. SM34]|uniref:hypothetical protein n=1 Tax=unclassified Shewanella TaxID=196818 RepID=UPI0021D83C28|nr:MULTISPECIES: hypothetical protein [unclassified Shewanella]MCU8058569.1 hypothetical protein [Shewanella sp. SM35]MCU8067521.1 hypothetical protein [Shewanella sp. SM34]